LIDANGKPVSGARVGTYIDFKDKGPQIVVPTFAFRNPVKIESDREGLATIPAITAFDAKFRNQPSVPIYIVHGTRRLMAEIELHRSDFDQKTVREVRMLPACDVHGRLTSLGLMAAGKNLSWTNVLIFKPGELGSYTFQCDSKAQTFDWLLPTGDFGMEAYGEDAQSAYHYIRIAPDQEEINLQLDLPPATVTQLIGHPAPPLTQIKGWMNGGPVKLSDLRGKLVLLEFWGTWCGPCVYSMPALMKVYDENKNKGLAVIAVHDDSLDSTAALSVKLDQIRNMKGPGWNGRELPFPVALDGGGPTRIKYSSKTGSGATTAAYGINSFPTTIAVGRDGNVIGIVTVRSPEGLAKIQKLIDSK
jgi:thiol-disulfide isomerase/thioredoxin